VRAPLSDGTQSAYVPFGPEVAPEPGDVGSFLERLSEELRPLLGTQCAFIRWDLPWMSLHARDPEDFAEDGQWHGPPPDRLREIRMNFGTADHNLRKAPRDLLPPDTMLVDLSGSEEAILARMHYKTRYNIRLSQRRGVVVQEGSVDDLPAWYEIYAETATRNRFEPMPLAHFQAMLDVSAERRGAPVAVRLLLARHEGRLLAGLLLAIAPERATYLYGASTHERRNLMASSAIQWAAIRLARAHHCRDYDLFGASPRGDSPHALAGVHRFKAGFGGAMLHREGCWDYPYDDAVYAEWRAWEEALVQRRGIAGPESP